MENEIIKKCNPCQFYGFFVSLEDLAPFLYPETIDVDHEDITNQKLIENGK